MGDRGWLRAAILTLILLLAVTAFAIPRHSAAQSPGVYIALGDSLAAGIGSSLPRRRAYPAIVHGWIEQHAGGTVPFANLAVPGETAQTFMEGGQLARFREEVARTRSARLPLVAVTLTLGGNEMLAVRSAGTSDRQAALDAFRQAYPAALAAVRQEIGPEVPLLATTYYDPTGGEPSLTFTDSWWIAQFNAAIVDAAQGAARVVDGAAAFAGQIDRLTRYPVDFHPTNAGHLALARVVWRAMGRDDDAPVVDAPEELVATRTAPTLRFRVSDDVAVASVAVSLSTGWASKPLEIEPGEWVVLIMQENMDYSPVDIVVTATDDAGNTSERTVRLRAAEAAASVRDGDGAGEEDA